MLTSREETALRALLTGSSVEKVQSTFLALEQKIAELDATRASVQTEVLESIGFDEIKMKQLTTDNCRQIREAMSQHPAVAKLEAELAEIK